MRVILNIACVLLLASGTAVAQRSGQSPQEPDDVVRITTALVQTDVVVMDKNDKIVSDLKLEDFALYENGKKQEIKFLEFVSAEPGVDRRTEGERPRGLPAGAEIPRDISARELRRVIAFVVDDLTIAHSDMITVRQVLQDFVSNQMKEGDLVAIVRVVGGKGLLQQFTADKQLLSRAIAALNITTHPLMTYNNPAPDRFSSNPAASRAGAAAGEGGGTGGSGESEVNFEELGLQNLNDPNDDTQRLLRGYFSLTTANAVIDGLKEIPGRKSMVLISGGIPIFEVASAGTAYSNVTYLLQLLTDNAVRAGVVINTMDPRGLKASAGVVSFVDTPGRSALGNSPDPNFGRGGSSAGRADVLQPAGNLSGPTSDPFGPLLGGAAEHLGLSTVANATGGVAVVNTNNFKSGLDKMLARANGYYVLAYTPVDKFDNKFRRLEIKVKRDNVRTYSHRGYVARADRSDSGTRTKEEVIMAAAKSPIARRDLDVSANINLKPAIAGNKTALDIHVAIDAKTLSFTQTPDGKYQTSFDVVGFIYDQFGKVRGGFSETINTALSAENHKEALRSGLTYSATTELPPGYFQIRTAVRETGTGNLGTVSRYLEIPNLGNGRLAISSVFVFAADPAETKKTGVPLLAVRQLSQKQDLRYAAQIFNAKTSGKQAVVKTQMIISQGSKIVYREPEQALPVEDNAPATKIGQLGLSKVSPGRYLLTVVVTDPLADKKHQVVARSVDFTVVP